LPKDEGVDFLERFGIEVEKYKGKLLVEDILI
jgi:hypothetical protein